MQPLSLRAGTLAACALASTLAAQPPYLHAIGGSNPGTLQLDLFNGPVGKLCAIVPSISPGPTPLAIVDPGDIRILNVGTESLALTLVGAYLPPSPNRFTTSVIPINNPSFNGVPIYWQGFDFPGSPRLVGNISNPAVTRFAAANSMRNGPIMATSRSFGEVIDYGDGRWMVCGGGQGAVLAQIALKSTEIYDQLTDTWVPGPNDMTTERTLFRALKMADGRYLLAAGFDTQNRSQNTAEIYDPATKQFTAVAPLLSARSSYRAILLPDGRCLYMGGFTHTTQTTITGVLISATKSTEIYDPATNTWTAGPNMTVPRASAEVVDLGGGKWLVMGGVGPFNHPQYGIIPLVYGNCDIYDAATNTFTPTASMPTTRAAFGAVKIGGKVLAAGGGETITATSPGTTTPKCDVYDIATATWTTTSPLATDRAFHFCFPLDATRAIAIGGANGNLVILNPLASCEIWDSTTGTWSAGASLPVPVTAYGPYETPHGQIHLVGGAGAGNMPLFSSAFYYR